MVRMRTKIFSHIRAKASFRPHKAESYLIYPFIFTATGGIRLQVYYDDVTKGPQLLFHDIFGDDAKYRSLKDRLYLRQFCLFTVGTCKLKQRQRGSCG